MSGFSYCFNWQRPHIFELSYCIGITSEGSFCQYKTYLEKEGTKMLKQLTGEEGAEMEHP